MLTCFFGTDVIMHKEFLPPGETANGRFHASGVPSGATIRESYTTTIHQPTRHFLRVSFQLQRRLEYYPTLPTPQILPRLASSCF